MYDCFEALCTALRVRYKSSRFIVIVYRSFSTTIRHWMNYDRAASLILSFYVLHLACGFLHNAAHNRSGNSRVTGFHMLQRQRTNIQKHYYHPLFVSRRKSMKRRDWVVLDIDSFIITVSRKASLNHMSADHDSFYH